MTEPAVVRVWLSLGSNIDRQRHITQALHDLKAQFGELVISRVYESEAVGFDGESFYNLVVGIETGLPAETLAQRLRGIEDANGRVRSGDKYTPRTLDIDLLTYGDQVIDTPKLQLPRDEITRYAFVLLPLSEVAGEEMHPRSGKNYQALWDVFEGADQRLWPVDDQPADRKEKTPAP